MFLFGIVRANFWAKGGGFGPIFRGGAHDFRERPFSMPFWPDGGYPGRAVAPQLGKAGIMAGPIGKEPRR